ncbi:MAG: CCA tRNA nucleotidyltransferase [Clostridia bacterium]|nr:CCA tRNA nucleotidyltransferase [Clostridia bacterium]
MNPQINARIPIELRELAGLFQLAGIPLFCVGGCVRDWILGRTAADIDLCSKASPDAVIALCKQNGIPAEIQSEKTGTVRITLNGRSYEHTAFRIESYEGGRHRPKQVIFGGSLEQDAGRRDFSINAIYYDIAGGRLQDPAGGLADLSAGRIRTTSANPYTILRHDGLRILRLVRFAFELGFSIEEATFECAREQAHLLWDVSFERKRDELIKILLLDEVYAALCCMDELNLFPYIIPELTACRGVKQRSDHHEHDVLHHLFHAAENINKEPALRLAALLHDIGKPRCLKETGRMRLHHRYSAQDAKQVLLRLRLPKADIDRIVFAVENHMFDIRDERTEDEVRRRFCIWGERRVWDMIALREADVLGSGKDASFRAERWRRIIADMTARKTPFSYAELALNGDEIMAILGIPPSKEVARAQRSLLLHCAAFPEHNTKGTLRELLISGQIAL